MKSQDVLLLIKLICLEQRERLQQQLDSETAELFKLSNTADAWQGWGGSRRTRSARLP